MLARNTSVRRRDAASGMWTSASVLIDLLRATNTLGFEVPPPSVSVRLRTDFPQRVQFSMANDEVGARSNF